MTAAQNPVALVTGANKGIGLEVARKLGEIGIHVAVGSRDRARGIHAVEQLKREGHSVELAVVDVNSQESIDAAIAALIKQRGRIDILVNNAGILLDWDDDASTLNLEKLRQTMETNFYGALRMVRAVLPHMQARGYGRIVNVSSTMGSLSYNSGGGGSSAPTYRLSKTALNGLTAIYSQVLRNGDIKINSASPGWVRTDMGGKNATRSVDEGTDTIIWLATLPKSGPNGGFFKDRKPQDW